MTEHRTEKEKYLFEEMSVKKAFLRLAFPTVAGQVILVIYNMADTYFIGVRGNDAMLAAVTVCMPAFMFLSAIANLFGVGGSAAISRNLGAEQYRRAQQTSVFSFWGCTVVTILYCLGTFLFLDPMINLLGGSAPSVHEKAREYMLCVVTVGGICSSMSILLSHLIRAEGDSITASTGLALGGILNILMDPLFMFVLLPPGREVQGAAIATAISNACSLLFYFLVLSYRKRRAFATVLSFLPMKEALSDGIPKDVFVSGLPACVMTLFENISYAVMEKLISAYGVPVQAGIGVAKKINMLSHCAVRGIAQGALPLVAYNYSAGNMRRMREAIHVTVAAAVLTAGLFTGVYLLAAPELVKIFIRQPSASRANGILFLRILCVGAPFSACAYTCISFFQAVGKGANAFLLALTRKGIVDIPLMFLCGAAHAASLIVWATPVTDMICCGFSILLYLMFARNLHVAVRRQPT